MENPFNRSKDQIVGPTNLEKEKENAELRLRHLRHKGTEPVSLEDVEVEKTPRFKEVFNLANNAILEKIAEFGLPQPQSLEDKRIHILPEEYTELEMEENLGQYKPLRDEVLIKEQSAPNFFRTMIHELLHAYSINKFYIKKDEDNTIALGQYRSGYALENRDPENNSRLFEYFNEAVIDILAKEITTENRVEFCKAMGFHESFADPMFIGINDPYEYPIKLLRNVVEKTVQLNSITEEALWVQIKKGLFTGEMMHLRIFEKTFGPKTLRVLASYQKNFSGNKRDIFDDDQVDDTYEKYIAYFNANPQEREKIADDLIMNVN